jgi:DNA recombination protein RmuC
MEFILAIAVFLIIVGLLIFFNVRSAKQIRDLNKGLEDSLDAKMKEIMPDVLKNANEQLIMMADEKLGSEKKQMKVDLEGKRMEIERLVKVIQEDLKESKKSLSESDKERIGSFMELKNKLEEYSKVTTQLSTTTENLKKMLSNNQLRGQFGEQIADELLKMAGFVRGFDYEVNKEQAGSETRPDFCVYLPDKTKINVDSKFPYANLQRVTEAETEEEKNSYMKKFEKDVKEKIKQVCTRDYINPDDNTVDFVILFIPNEMVFSYIYDKLNDVWKEAMEKKVILAGPFSFTAILRMVRQAYQNFSYQKNIRQVIGHVQSFEKEFEKFQEEFFKVGDKIKSLDGQYQKVSTTRVNQLSRRVDKIKLDSDDDDEKLDETKKLKEPLEKDSLF